MNALYYVNKAFGIAFAVGLTGFLGYRAYLWRNEMGKEAGKRLQHRLVQMSQDPRYQLPKSDFKIPEVKFSAESLQGVGGAWKATNR